ncbi:hypothetical protein NBRC116592_03930 [Colwellia sp. KU-HH00111]|uniref:hypothetical protein n=1 Tax=Colwellia sp. KU-HH00111 TaxID=3127652 RepID=UPI003107D2A2
MKELEKLKALNNTIKHLLPEPFDIQLEQLLNKKVNSCWEGNVKGFWLKIPIDEQTQFNRSITRAKIEISFLKPIKDSQIKFEFTKGYKGYLSDEENDINDIVMALHNKNLVASNSKHLIDTILFTLNINVLDEDFLARQIYLKQEQDLIRTLRKIQSQQVEEKGLEFLLSIADKVSNLDKTELREIYENKGKFFQELRDSEDFILNTKKLKAAEQAYLNT